MRHTVFSFLTLVATGQAASCASARKFTLKTTYDASNFFDKFHFRDAAYYNSIDPAYEGDPTHGSVNYLNMREAQSSGIISASNTQVYIGVDSRNKAKLIGSSKTKHGRDSVRLESKETFDSGILIADIEHMPGTACGVWPSFWTYNFDEDPVGEIDIIEGINDQSQNVVSLHTCGACKFTNIGGLDQRDNCNNGGTESDQCEDGTNFDGCGNTHAVGSYGSAFNKAKGGVYATWLESNSLKIYWFPREKIPSDIKAGKPDPTRWGEPASKFLSGPGCDVRKYFKGQTINALPILQNTPSLKVPLSEFAP
ncbi:mixed-linked glucanase precursor mlg1 [Fusarium longipes]|uniref:Mixed-linked glucanase mlg1 n=1 Tax=Fusarium longipes TaxID=694270 RepID=A0A395T5L0_9HYPO|nr:mixed-linked glucanase precursor mlg1 [Fusarium longipes]